MSVRVTPAADSPQYGKLEDVVRDRSSQLAVKEFAMQLRRQQIAGTKAVAETTAKTIRAVVSSAKYRRLEELVDDVVTQGYAVARDELDVGLTAVAAPVRNAHGEVCASVSVSGPSFRIDEERVDQILPLLLQAAGDVSARLGWHAA